MYSVFLPLMLLLPLTGAAVLFALRRRVSRRAVAWIGCLSVFLAFLATLGALAGYLKGGAPLKVTLWGWQVGGRDFSLGLLGDAVSLWFMVVVTGVGFLIHLFSAGYMAHEPDYGRYFAKLNYFIFAMSVLILADSFLGLAIGWANVGLASYMLIGFYFWRPAASAAAMKAFVTNMVGEVFMLAGMGAIFYHFGSIQYEAVFARAAEMAGDPALTLIGLLLLVGACAKSAQLPLHIWLPDAMQGPTPVSALIHAATMVTAGVYLVARAYPIYHGSETAMAAVATVGALGALMGAVVATRQYDIKRVLAYSTMSQVGYMFLGNGVGAHIPALFHFMTHAFFKALLFLTAGAIIHDLGGEQDIRKMGGLARKMPLAYRVFAIGTLALVGIPPFAGFFSKDAILEAAFAGHHYVLWLIGLVAAGFTAFYNTRLFGLVFLGEPAEVAAAYRSGKRNRRLQAAAAQAHAPAGDHELPLNMKLPLLVLAVLSAVGGLMAVPHGWNLPAAFLGEYFHRWSPDAGHGEVGLGTLLGLIAVTLAAAAVGIWAGWKLYGPAGSRREAEQASAGEPADVVGKGFLFDDLYEAVAVQPARALSAWAAETLDPRVLDGAVGGLAALAGRLSGWVSRLHSGYLRRYALTAYVGLLAAVLYYMFAA